MPCDLTAVLPSYLDERNLRVILPRIKGFCQNLIPNFDILVVAPGRVEGRFTENNKTRVLMSFIVNSGYRLVLGLNCRVVNNHFKPYPRFLLRSLNSNLSECGYS